MPTLTIQRMRPDDAARTRAIRLRALEEAPDAFGTTLAEDLARPPDAWRTRLESADAATYVAVLDGLDIGMATGASYEWVEGSAGLFGMWVAPEARQIGAGGQLVDAVVAWARAAGFPRILLDVGDENPPAIALYASRGFEPTGVTSSLPPPRDHVTEHQRRLAL